MRVARFPVEVQKLLSSEDILATASEDGTSSVRFCWLREENKPESWNRKTQSSETGAADLQSCRASLTHHGPRVEVGDGGQDHQLLGVKPDGVTLSLVMFKVLHR